MDKDLLTTSNTQNSLWHDEHERLQFAELVNVFYAREIPALAKRADQEQISRALQSLPYYVERAARHIVQGCVPLELDSHNGSWLCSQKAQPKWQADVCEGYFKRYAVVGLVVPIIISSDGLTRLAIDTIDQVRDNTVHCNQHQWFNCSGRSHDNDFTMMLKPSKALLSAACCGHQWRFGKAISPRILSLREMLLASMINWKNVRTIKKRPY
ncbi:hypothetical protein PCIT_a2100 [Pseudoalteromonas citrea]|uniref:Uncharacterized protein n=2 Tax=Pseudoalteromonas citrea TaxID=43655 RepID=A0AAD4AJM9_9GAMM|nr:hypothetical protein [Pseudoalteromonas citrea]KAF7772100.1 hypothetical protein PCIT_a2100 [Pseudoalteromonas citrea]